MQQFLNDPADVSWLMETALKGIPLSRPFASFVLFGNEDSPDKLHLYESADPLYSDSYLEVTFPGAPIYCVISEREGA